MTFRIVAAVACVVLSAFFSASEMALSSANRVRLSNLAENGNRGARLALSLLDRFDDALSAILIGNNFVNIALSSLASLIAISSFGEQYAWLSTVIVTVTVIIFGETIPKIISKKHANSLSQGLSGFIAALCYILRPVNFVVVKITALMTMALGRKDEAEADDEKTEELQAIIETAEDEGVIEGIDDCPCGRKGKYFRIIGRLKSAEKKLMRENCH